MSMNLTQVAKELHLQALESRAEADRLERAVGLLTALSNGRHVSPAGRRVLSAASRRKISLAAKARWAKVKAKRAAFARMHPAKRIIQMKTRRGTHAAA